MTSTPDQDRPAPSPPEDAQPEAMGVPGAAADDEHVPADETPETGPATAAPVEVVTPEAPEPEQSGSAPLEPAPVPDDEPAPPTRVLRTLRPADLPAPAGPARLDAAPLVEAAPVVDVSVPRRPALPAGVDPWEASAPDAERAWAAALGAGPTAAPELPGDAGDRAPDGPQPDPRAVDPRDIDPLAVALAALARQLARPDAPGTPAVDRVPSVEVEVEVEDVEDAALDASPAPATDEPTADEQLVPTEPAVSVWPRVDVPVPDGASVEPGTAPDLVPDPPGAHPAGPEARGMGGPVPLTAPGQRGSGRWPSTGAQPVTAAPAPSAGPSASSAWRILARSLRPRATRAQTLAGLLCGLLGFAVVVQVRQTHDDGLSTLRQSELVGILDQTTRQADELEREADALERTRQQLLSGSTSSQAALDAAKDSAATQGILAGRLPAEGPGLLLTIADPERSVRARTLLNLLEELRNSGAEAIDLNGLRLTASSYVVEVDDGIVVDGTRIEGPYRWQVIGDPDTMANALEIPGGAFATVRNDGGRPTATRDELVEITSTRTVPEPRYATPVVPSTE
jgi:uncharacterized protein YlxW (UPF0749 family)